MAKAVLVTGAGSGIGREVARVMIADGVRIVGVDIDAAALKATAGELGAAFTPLTADIAKDADIARAAEAAFAAAPGLDGLVNCAGIYPVAPFLELAADEWDRVLALNLRTPFLLTQALARRWVAAKTAAAVVNISSTSSIVARPGVAHYGASKAAINQLTRELAVELAPHRIRVNAVAPGLVLTERVRVYAEGEGRTEHEAKLMRIPAGREGTPREIAEAVAWLLSEKSAYCMGTVLFVDGGFSLGLPRY